MNELQDMERHQLWPAWLLKDQQLQRADRHLLGRSGFRNRRAGPVQ